MNIAIITGRVATDPEMKEQRKKNGRLYCRYRFCIEGDYRGELFGREIQFITVCAFGKAAERQFKTLYRGVRALLYGKIKIYEREDHLGVKREAFCFVATNFEWIDAKREQDPVQDLRGSDGKLLIPKELTASLMKSVDYNDEDIPEDIFYRG